MLLRLLIRKVCKTRAELRRVWRLFVHYRALSPEARADFRVTDICIRRSFRLSALWAVIRLQLDTPHLVVLGLIGVAGLLWQVAGAVFRLITKG